MQKAVSSEFWGKFDATTGFHPLRHHCADVAACFEQLLQQPTINKRLAATAGLDRLDESLVSRLAALVFLHDLGKIAVGFQLKTWPERPANAPPRSGHLYPVITLIFSDRQAENWIHDALQSDALSSWDENNGDTLASLLLASFAHHGTPLALRDAPAEMDVSAQWATLDKLNPRREAIEFGRCLRNWFAPAFAPGATPLPHQAQFHHAFAGLVALADWLGSSQDFFRVTAPFNDTYMRTARKRAQRALAATGIAVANQRERFVEPTQLARLFPKFNKLRPLQQAVHDAPTDAHALILEAETGAGKTEAALLRFVKLYAAGEVDSLYFALPTRSAAVQLHTRVCEFAARLFGQDAPQVVLAVPGYLKAGQASGDHLPGFVVEWDDAPGEAIKAARWAAHNSRRYLAAQIAVGTIDQVMLSAMPVKHAHMRASCLMRSLLVIDELHASDGYMSEIVGRVVKQQLATDGHVLMMSATLSAQARESWLGGHSGSASSLENAISSDYPALSYQKARRVHTDPVEKIGNSKSVTLRVLPTSNELISSTAWQAARQGAKVLVIRNTVKEAMALLEQVERDSNGDTSLMFQIDGVATLHHSRFAAEDRQLLDSTVEQWLGGERKKTGTIVIGTQTLEQSLDIDADLLLTDLCPIDVLLQRIGRLHRHARIDRAAGYENAKAVVISPNATDLQSLLNSVQIGLGNPAGDRSVYPDVVSLQSTLNCINDSPEWELPRMNRQLIESVLHSDSRNTLLAERGEDWQLAAQARWGIETSNIQQATQNPLPTHLTFLDDELRFPREISLPTRLGANNVQFRLENSVKGPFSEPVQNFNIPGWMLMDLDVELDEIEISVLNHDSNGLDIDIGGRGFRYSRYGLRRS